MMTRSCIASVALLASTAHAVRTCVSIKAADVATWLDADSVVNGDGGTGAPKLQFDPGTSNVMCGTEKQAPWLGAEQFVIQVTKQGKKITPCWKSLGYIENQQDDDGNWEARLYHSCKRTA